MFSSGVPKLGGRTVSPHIKWKGRQNMPWEHGNPPGIPAYHLCGTGAPLTSQANSCSLPPLLRLGSEVASSASVLCLALLLCSLAPL